LRDYERKRDADTAAAAAAEAGDQEEREEDDTRKNPICNRVVRARGWPLHSSFYCLTLRSFFFFFFFFSVLLSVYELFI
jgi:hypothetical protein